MIVQVSSIKIYDLTGHLLRITPEKLNAGENKLPLNTSLLVKGIYTLQVVTEDKNFATLRFVKQ